MKKSAVRWIAVLLAICLAYNIVVFAMPFSKKSAVFWVCYGFTMVAILAQLFVVWSSSRREDIKSKFYGFPTVYVGCVYLVVQLGLGLRFMSRWMITPVWMPLVTGGVLLAAAVIGFVGTDVLQNEVERQDRQHQVETFLIRELQSKVQSMLGGTNDPELAVSLRKLAEDLRYSDPVSTSALWTAEHTLANCVDKLQKAIFSGDKDEARELCGQAVVLLAERNRQCKAAKG